MPERLELQHLVFLNGATQNSNSSRKDFVAKLVTKLSCPFLGIFLATLSSLFFSLCSVIVKWLDNVHPMELAAFRFVGVLLPTIPFLIRNGSHPFPEGKRIMLLLRCFVGTMGLMLSFYAFRHMPLSDASIIIFSTPVFVVIFAKLFLNEPCGMFNVVTIFFTLIGVLFITRPPLLFDTIDAFAAPKAAVPGNSKQFDMFRNSSSVDLLKLVPSRHGTNEKYAITTDHRTATKLDNIWGPVAAISSTLFGANAYVLLRALKGLHFSVIMTNFGSFALVYTLLVSYFVFGALCLPACGTDRLLVVALAIFSFLGQILLTLALQIEQAGPVALARSSDIFFAFIWQVIFFNESPNRYSLIGAALVIISVVLTALRKWLLTLPTDSLLRQRLHVLAQE